MCVRVCSCACVLITQLCPTLCNLMDYSPTVSFVHRIPQARILEWGAIIGTAQMLMQMINGQGLGFPCSSENKDFCLVYIQFEILVGHEIV